MASWLLFRLAVKRVLANATGISLTEVLVAVLIFLTVVVGLGKSVLAARRTGDSSRQLVTATSLAVDKIEHLRTLVLASADVLPGSHSDGTLTAEGAAGGPFTRRWSVTEDTPLAGMRRVEMTVTWHDRTRTGSVTLVTYLSLA